MPSRLPSKFWVIIPAAGVGSRMQSDKPKQYLKVQQKTILEHTLDCFLAHSAFDNVYVGISKQDKYFEEHGLHLKKGVKTFSGGKERADTVLNGLDAISAEAKGQDWVWVHDAARPCLSMSEINLLLTELEHVQEGLVLGVPVSDTLKRVSSLSHSNGLSEVQATVDRTGLWRAMTPQIFKYADLRNALEYCQGSNQTVTDEASAIEAFGKPVFMVAGHEQNIKVTLPADLEKVERYFYFEKKQKNYRDHNEYKAPEPRESALHKQLENIPKIGTGYDVHAFGKGVFVTLGGVKIPYDKGLVAHSDGDVLLHAIMDALLGALALGDIGKHFPDTDAKWKGANSRDLLRAVGALIQEHDYKVGNIDSTVIAQAPKMAPHIAQMQSNIAEDLNIDSSCVSVKATTTEKLGFTGRKEGIACQASVLLVASYSMEGCP